MLAACTAATSSSPPPAPVDWKAFDAKPDAGAAPKVATAKERAVAEAYAAGLASPGFASLGPLLDDDVRLTFPGMEDAHGRGSTLHAHDVLLGAFEPRAVATTRVFRTDSAQAVEWVLSGTQVKDWMAVPAKHKPVVIKGLSLIWTKDDGTITEVHAFFDVAVVKAQLGVGPKELVALPLPQFPSGPPQVYEQSGSEAEKADVTAARAAIDALEGNDESAYVDTKADDIEYYTLEQAQPELGKEAARTYFKAMRKAIGQLDTTIDNSWGIANYAVIEYSIAGAQLGPIGWIPAHRDQVVRLNMAQVNEVRNGKVARIWRYDNPLEAVSQGP